MIIEISKGKARQRFSKLCAEANDAMPIFTVNQKLPDGSTREYTRRAKRISDGAQQTGAALIMYYAAHYRTVLRCMPEGWTNDGLPTLPANGELLAQFRQNICARTSRNHIRQLMDIGLILKKTFHGTKSNFELTFNPAILFGEENANLTAQMPQFSASATTKTPQALPTPPAGFSNTNGTNFPLKQAIETNGNHTTTTRQVENSIKLKPLEGIVEWKPVEELSKNQEKNGNTARETSKNGIEAGFKADGNGEAGPQKIHSVWSAMPENVDNSTQNVDKSVDKWKSDDTVGVDFNRQNRLVQNEIISFWKYAKAALWLDRNFTETEWLMTADLIMDSVFRPFLRLKPSEPEFREWMAELTAAVNVAKKYYDNNPQRYPGHPYSTTERNLGYFDSRNPKGFNVACNWRFVNKAKMHEEEGWRVVKTAIMHLNKHPEGKAPKNLQIKTFGQVVEFYKAKLKRYKPEVQNLFLQRLNTLNIFHP